MYSARWVEVGAGRHERDDNTAALCLSDVIPQRPRDRVQRQRAAREAMYEFQPVHFASAVRH